MDVVIFCIAEYGNNDTSQYIQTELKIKYQAWRVLCC